MAIWRPLLKRVFQAVTNESITTVIDLLRHGEVAGGKMYRGQLDDPLTERGWQQLRHTTVNKQAWQQIISSPLKRCADFASELGKTISLPVANKPEFKEISFGLWEGKTADELLESDESKIKQYWNDPVKTTPPQGENLLDFEKRIIHGWNNMVNEFQGKHVLMVSHAGVIRVILCHVLGMPLTELFKLDVGLAKASRIQIEHIENQNWPRLIFHGGEFI